MAIDASATATIIAFVSSDKLVLSSREGRNHSTKATKATITLIPTIILIKKKCNAFCNAVWFPVIFTYENFPLYYHSYVQWCERRTSSLTGGEVIYSIVRIPLRVCAFLILMLCCRMQPFLYSFSVHSSPFA